MILRAEATTISNESVWFHSRRGGLCGSVGVEYDVSWPVSELARACDPSKLRDIWVPSHPENRKNELPLYAFVPCVDDGLTS